MVNSTRAENATPPAPVRHGGKPIRIIIFAVIAAVVAYFVWRHFNEPTNPHLLSVSGRLEGYETNLSPKIGGRVLFIKYREGDAVKEGELIAQLNDEDYQAQLRGSEARILKAQDNASAQNDQITMIKAQVLGAEKHLGQSKEETSAQIDNAQHALSQAQAKLVQARADWQQSKSQLQLSTVRLTRYTDLVKKGAVTKDEYDQAVTTFNNDTDNVKSKLANVDASSKQVEMMDASLKQTEAARYTPPIRTSELNAFQAQLDQSHNNLTAAKQDVANAVADRDQVQANLGYLQIRSPITGVVTARPVEPGAVMTPGQTILTVLDYGKVYMRGYVPEGSIGSIRIGSKATVYLDGMPKHPFKGKVIEIDPEGSFTPENIYFKNDRVKQVFGIKIGIENPEGFAKPGMPADANIEI